MNDRQPWSVRGVDREARELALRAAHERRMTIGEWLSEAVLEAARRDLDPPPAGSGANLPAGRERTGDLADALGALVAHLEKGGGGAGDLARRIDRTEAALTGRLEQIAAAMYGVMQTVERQGAATIDGRERAAEAGRLDRMAERIAAVADAETRRTEQMDAIAEALALLAARVGDPRARSEPDPGRPEAETAARPAEDGDEPLTVWPPADDGAEGTERGGADRPPRQSRMASSRAS